MAKINYVYDATSNIINADPGSGKMRFDQATPGASIAFCLSNTDNSGNGQTFEVARWDNSSKVPYGRLIINNTTQFGQAIFQLVYTPAFQTGYMMFGFMGCMSSVGAFSNGDVLELVFIPDHGPDSLVWGSITTSNSIANSTSETDFNQQFTLPANAFSGGSQGNGNNSLNSLHFRYAGVYSSTGTPTLAFQLKATDPTPTTNVIVNTGGLPVGTNASSKGFVVDIHVIMVNPATNTVRVTAEISINGLAPYIIATGDVTLDPTVAQTFKLTGQWSAASASNTVALRSAKVELASEMYFPLI